MSWLTYWNKKNIWIDSDIWKKNNEIFYKKTSDIFNYNKKHKVLDIGCGNGDFAKKISNKVGQVYCLDTSQEFINLCKINVSNKNNIKIDGSVEIIKKSLNKEKIIHSFKINQTINKRKTLFEAMIYWITR